MRLVDFQFEHLELFEWREHEKKMYNAGSAFLSALLTVEKTGEGFTAVHDGRILGIGGIVPVTQKTGFAFTLLSVYADRHPVAVARVGRRMFHRMFEDMGLHRITTYNLEQAEAHHKWCEWLGFTREGRLEKYDDAGQTYIQYGMVR